MQKSGLAVILAVLATCIVAIPRARFINHNPKRFKGAHPRGSDLLVDAQIGSLLRNAPDGSQLIRTIPVIPSLIQRLPDNSTLIRPNIVDTFRCDQKGYGYYADVDNECQIFHVCVPLKQLYPANFTTDITYQFSFICPEHTVFTQDAMVCAWETEALPCSISPDLYWLNRNFFRMVPDTEKGFGERYAHVNEPQR